MTIALADLAKALTTYLDDEVTVDITKVTTNVEKNEEGSFTLTVTNAAAPNGVKLTGLALHMTLDDPAVMDILGKDDPAGIHTSRQDAGLNSPVVVNGQVAPNGQMCVFFNGDAGVLDVGKSATIEIEYRGKNAGTTTLKVHPHASVSSSTLFPPNQAGVNSKQDITILT
jgi:hypothetical protein